MVSVVQGPLWFLQTSVGFEIASAIILGLIAISVLKYYFLTRTNKWLHLGFAFALLSAATLGHGILGLGLAVKPWGILSGGVVQLAIHVSLLRSVLFFALVFLMEFLFLYGLFLLYSAYHDVSKSMHGLVGFLLLLLLYFSADNYFVYHLLALVFALLISTSLIKSYRKSRRSPTLWLAGAFGLIGLSRFLYLFVPFHSIFFVVASVLQIVALVLILIVFGRVVYRAKKISS